MPPPSLRSQSNRHLLNPRILVVDTGPDSPESLKKVIAMAAPLAEITRVESGEAALHELARQTQHAAFIELGVPGLSGLALLTQIAKRYPETVRIVHSSRIETVGAELVGQLAHRVLSKPASAHDILAATRWALSRADRELCVKSS